MDVNSELADAMLAEYRAFEEYYRCRNADPETRQEKLEAWCGRRRCSGDLGTRSVNLLRKTAAHSSRPATARGHPATRARQSETRPPRRRSA
jgi:hypothetical protein